MIWQRMDWKMNKAIIVNRVSSKKQNPILQEKDCIDFAEKKGYDVIKIFQEIASAGKSKQKSIHEAEELAIKEKADIIVWKYDRSFRNKKDFADFMLRMYELYNIKVYSVQEEWVNMLWEMTEIKLNLGENNEHFEEKLKKDLKSNWILMIKIIGKLAEDEIKDKGARVRLAVKKKNGQTISYKGNLWGRPKKINEKIIKEVLELTNNMSVREIAQSVWYYDKNRNQKFISPSAVHKIIKENRQKLKETSS